MDLVKKESYMVEDMSWVIIIMFFQGSGGRRIGERRGGGSGMR